MKPLSGLRVGDEVAIITQGCLGQSAKVGKVKTATQEFIEVEFRSSVEKLPLVGSRIQSTSEDWLSTDPALIARIKAVPTLRRIKYVSGRNLPTTEP
jgi:hypothetical protein